MGVRQFHYWIIVPHDHETGKPYIIYGCPAREGEEGCRSRGRELLGSTDFIIKRFPTRDMQTASRYWRHREVTDDTKDGDVMNKRVRRPVIKRVDKWSLSRAMVKRAKQQQKAAVHWD